MEERYRKLIEAMYGGGQEVIIEAPVTYRDGRKGVVTTSIKVRSSNSQGGING
jgi:long-chain acyl-CoA synthetase